MSLDSSEWARQADELGIGRSDATKPIDWEKRRVGDETPFMEVVRMALAYKRRSVFCLEPRGYNAGRPSHVQALLSGCIPVFFSHYWSDIFVDGSRGTVWDNYLPLHFRWRDKVAVVWNRSLGDGTSAEAIESADALVRHLQHLNASGEARRMQLAIARHARQLVYGLDGFYEGDAVDTLVQQLDYLLHSPSKLAVRECRSLFGEMQQHRCERPDPGSAR